MTRGRRSAVTRDARAPDAVVVSCVDSGTRLCRTGKQEGGVVIPHEELNKLYDAEVVDQDGERIGMPGEVYVDNRTGDPAWLTVRAGWFGARKVFVPLATAEVRGDQIQVPYSTAKVRDAPDVVCDGHLSEDDEQELYTYYGVEEGPAPSA